MSGCPLDTSFSSFYLPSSVTRKSDQSPCFGQHHGGSSASDSHTLMVGTGVRQSKPFCYSVSENNINSKFCMQI